MPRPSDITPEFVKACDEEMRRYRRQQRAGGKPYRGVRITDALFDIPHFREAWVCGAWLHQQLRNVGCPDRLARDTCFANGQKIAMSADPWVPTLATLADYLRGKVDRPGPELAERLLRDAGMG